MAQGCGGQPGTLLLAPDVTRTAGTPAGSAATARELPASASAAPPPARLEPILTQRQRSRLPPGTR